MSINGEIGDYQMSWHAASRAVDMALDAEDIIALILQPHGITESDKHPGRDLHLRGRLAAAIDPGTKTVITLLWNHRYVGRRWTRDDIDLAHDEWTPHA